MTVTVARFLANRTTLDAAGSIAIADTSAEVAGSLDAIATDPYVTGIFLTDGATPLLRLTSAQFAAATAALSKITNLSFTLYVTNGDGSMFVRAITPSGRSDTTTNTSGRRIEFATFDASGNPLADYTYDTSGRLTSENDYAAGQLVFSVTYYAGTTLQSAVVQKSIIGASYNELDYTYAMDGTPIHQTLYAGAHVPIYDMSFDPTTRTRATSFFDVLGNPAKTTTVNTDGAHDLRIYKSTDASTDFFYDAGNHLIRRLDFDTPTHTSVQYFYDSAGWLTSETDYAPGSTSPAFAATYYAGTGNPKHQDLYGIANKSYTALHIDYDPDNVIAKETLDLAVGGFAQIAFGDNRTLTSTAGVSDSLQASGASETYVFRAGMGHDTVTTFIGSGTGHDIAQFDASMFTLGRANILNMLTDFGTDIAGTLGINATPPSVLLTFDAANSVLLQGVTIATLLTHPTGVTFV